MMWEGREGGGGGGAINQFVTRAGSESLCVLFMMREDSLNNGNYILQEIIRVDI